MDTHSTRPGNVGDTLIYLSVSFLKVCGKYSAVRKYLIVAVVCFVYLFFTVHVSRASTRKDKRLDLWTGNSVYAQSKTDLDPADEEVNESVSPTRSNVVYITLKSKRHKPAIIRGTVRPKLRRKKVKVTQQGGTQGKLKDTRHKNIVNQRLGYSELDDSDIGYSSIRIYSERAPPWFSNDDITAMRCLADSKITQIGEVAPRGFSSFILFKSATNGTDDIDECRKCCGIVKRPLDMSEVFAFHLDRILGLNRTLPAVSRRFRSLGDGQLCPVVLWDPSLSPVEDQPSERLNWGSYQTSLKHKCWHGGVIPKPEWSCTSIHHHEWSKLVVFDFLLQIYERLDKNCCGFKPRPEDTCIELGHHEECRDKDGIELTHIIHRKHDPHHLFSSTTRATLTETRGI